MPQPLGMFAGDLFLRSKQFHEALERVMGDRQEPDLPHATYFLLYHHIELLLKAYLASGGVSKNDLVRVFKHNLKEALRECSARNLPDVDKLAPLVARLHLMNDRNDFRYPTGYVLRLPPLAECMPIVRDLIAVIEPVVASASATAQLRFASDTRHLKHAHVKWSD